ncbi:PH and SEC7 domain-containing protein C11E3.11c [Cladobotryum mycophilum]|uniref:PH and SEC7 domain-containing protein C11E3.11c n=1 Tax=Cladobotryum mycophilum TaxID=491253 RepID=A0ABR0STW1_9HYPO
MADQHASRAPTRDSHDLSLSPRDVTRDSLVNNMLLSLDQFSLGQTGSTGTSSYGGPPVSFDDSARTWLNNAINAAAGRSTDNEGQRHHSLHHHHSYSSDLDAAAESSPPLARVPRSRRSNSSSTFRFPRPDNPRETILPILAQTATGTRALHSRGRGSISSTQIDTTGFPAGPSSWNRSGFRRSLSFDQGTRQALQQQLNGPLLSPFRVDFSSGFTNDDDYYAAAPTPTVPGGPRRVPSAIQIPPPPPEPFDFPTLERKRSTSRSLRSAAGRSKRGANAHQVVPAMPVSDFDSAPAPSVSYGKPKTDSTGCSSPTTPTQPKEKQGFFRRVFGSKNNAPEAQPPTRYVSTPLQQFPSHTRTAATPPFRDVSSSYSVQPVLQKKPSSFFRRRKKSNADDTPPMPTDVPPVPPIDGSVQADMADPKSPASSLRKVMSPYLRDGSEAGHGGYALADITNTISESGTDDGDESREYKREFSPDYEPSPNAKIRAVTSDSDHDQNWTAESPTLQRPRRPNKAFEKRSNSFLDLDNGSDGEDDSPRQLRRQFMDNNRENGTGVGSSPVSGRSKEHNTTIRPSKKHTYKMDHGEMDLDDPLHLKLAIPGNRSTSFASGSTETDYKTAPSAPPSVRIEGANLPSPKILESLDLMKTMILDEPEFVMGDPTEDERQKAQQIYDGVEDFIPKEKAASWMGEEGPIRQRTLQAYIDLYDFSDLSVVTALRKVCSRLILRAETQQVDRILVAFSKRWCDCNPNHGFKATDVIHTICYSIMLLNTDLHVADIEQKMTRSQFVKNTLFTITQAVAEAAPDAFERPSILPEKNAFLGNENVRPSTEHDRRTFRNSFRPPARTDTFSSDMFDEAGPLVKTPFYGTVKAWEEQIEAVLKYTYVSIRDDRLPLFGAESDKHLANAHSQSSLSVMGMLKRSPSVLSKAPSEGHMSLRGRITDTNRNNNSRWTSKSRSRPGLGRNGFSSSRTSFDDANSMWSPALSSATWSRYSLGRTQGSMSQDSFGSAMPRGDFQQSIGFANALSQAIIRDEDSSVHDGGSIMSSDVPSHGPVLEDESLELSGPPWVKEGRVMHKHHLDGVGKRAKDRNWGEVFAVVQKGQMSLFSFNSSKSTRHKNRGRNGKLNGPVGGGNWQDNAVNLGTFNLRLTLASALPSPGYSRTRPFVWALSLPTGAVHLFQVGTPEIIKEFVDTANYWSARLSSHPLVGGISNIEYGWSDAVVNNSLVNAINDSSAASIASGRTSRPGSSTTHGRKSSVQSASLHTASIDQGSSAFTNSGGRGKLPGDRIHISNWSPPTQSMRPSNLAEIEQLDTLAAYVKSIEQELQTHNQLRSPMLLAFTPRGQNAGKAMANWERKSAYLLREIVKFRTYVDALQQAENRKREIYKERDLARRAARGELTDTDMEVSGAEEGDETLRP